MMVKGSEVWLMTNPSWNNHDNNNNTTAEALLFNSDGSKAKGGEKWCCKFGHSRRGLEHVTSPEEGRERQQKVQVAKQSVLREQRQQKAKNLQDPEQLRRVYYRASGWARELSLAAGASDAAAVQSNFTSTEQGRCRNYYLQYHQQQQQNIATTASVGNPVPQFMKQHYSLETPSSSAKLKPKVMDASSSSVVVDVKIHDAPQDARCYKKKASGFGTTDDRLNLSAVGRSAHSGVVARTLNIAAVAST